VKETLSGYWEKSEPMGKCSRIQPAREDLRVRVQLMQKEKRRWWVDPTRT